MKHLIDDIYLTQDKYQFILLKKGVCKSGKHNGEEKFDEMAYCPTYDSVGRVLTQMGFKQWVNGDFERCKNFISEAFTNLQKYIKENK